MKHKRIEMNPKVMGGKPVIKGTRIPVDLILRALGDGNVRQRAVGRLSAIDA